MNEDRFDVIYYIDTGYGYSQSRQHTLTVYVSDFVYCKTDQDIEDLLSEMLWEDMCQKVGTEANTGSVNELIGLIRGYQDEEEIEYD